jgi:hypothetical protein
MRTSVSNCSFRQAAGRVLPDVKYARWAETRSGNPVAIV